MKNYSFLILLCLALSLQLSAQNEEITPEQATVITFENDAHDFGDINEENRVKHVFKFKNTGDKPLTITNARGSCGCTVPEYPKSAIAPGESGEILVEFNPKGKKGSQTKYVTLVANTIPMETKLTIKANVLNVWKNDDSVVKNEELPIAKDEGLGEYRVFDNPAPPPLPLEEPGMYVPNLTLIKFKESEHDFGAMNAGDKVSYTFKFKNTGDKPLTIMDVKTSCGCTATEYPKEPIAPGKSGKIKIIFDSQGKSGNQTKYVTVTANTLPTETKLTIKAKVNDKK